MSNFAKKYKILAHQQIMLYTDEDFTIETLLAEVETNFDMDLYTEQPDESTIVYRTVDGSPMSKEISDYIWNVYDKCKAEYSRDYIRLFLS